MQSNTRTQELLSLRTGRELAEYLRELYVDRRWTDQEIADHLGIARSTVRTWREQFSIDRSDRKAALA